MIKLDYAKLSPADKRLMYPEYEPCDTCEEPMLGIRAVVTDEPPRSKCTDCGGEPNYVFEESGD